MSHRLRALVVIAACLAVGVFVLAYRGPGRAIVRGHLGDLAVAALLYFALALAFASKTTVRSRAALVAIVAFSTELFQFVGPSLRRSTLVDLTVGRTFDPWDLLAYALGIALAALIDRRWLAPVANRAQNPA
ncbi:MAG: DUF2809 domain-containing protein [Polyangiales bacterium]